MLFAFLYIFFSPSLTGVLPEIFHESEISHANGTLNMFSLLGAIAGVSFVPFYHYVLDGTFPEIIQFLVASSLLGFISAMYITQTISIVQVHRELVYSYWSSFWQGWREMRRTNGLFLAGFGDALFVSFGVAV